MVAGTVAHAEPAEDVAPVSVASRSVAMLGLEPLGIDNERALRLETLLRKELERLANRPLPTRRAIAEALRGTRLSRCTGDIDCLSAIGKRLRVELMISGTVAALGTSYVVNIKLVDAKAKKQLRRVASDPLTGDPDQLIEAVRLAAYRLLAPESITGQIAVLADVAGAEVSVDGELVGKIPLPGPISGLSPGPHQLEVKAGTLEPFSEKVRVRFQKTTRVIVHLAGGEAKAPVVGTEAPPPTEPRDDPWYASPWAMAGIGVAAIVVGGAIGYAAGDDDVIYCPGDC